MAHNLRSMHEAPSSVASTQKTNQARKESHCWWRQLQAQEGRMLFLSPNMPSDSSVWRKGWEWVWITGDLCDECLYIPLGMTFLFPLWGDCASSCHFIWRCPSQTPNNEAVRLTIEISRPPEAGARATLTARLSLPHPRKIHYLVRGSLAGILVLETENGCSSKLPSSATSCFFPGFQMESVSKWLTAGLHRMAEGKGPTGYSDIIPPLPNWQKWAPERLTVLCKGTQMAHGLRQSPGCPCVVYPKGLPTVRWCSSASPTTRPPSPLAESGTHFLLKLRTKTVTN